jgi:hypothetical protein
MGPDQKRGASVFEPDNQNPGTSKKSNLKVFSDRDSVFTLDVNSSPLFGRLTSAKSRNIRAGFVIQERHVSPDNAALTRNWTVKSETSQVHFVGT